MNEFDEIKAMMTKATPLPDADRKRANLARAEEIFVRRQESMDKTRLKGDKNKKGYLMSALKPFLAMTTAIAAVGVVAFVPFESFKNRDSRAPVETLAQENKSQETEIFDRSISRNESRGMMSNSLRMPEADAFSAAPMATQSMSRELAPMPMPMSVERIVVAPDTEEFANDDANPVKLVSQDPVSTFSSDVDTASYSIVRSSLMRGQIPPSEAVRVEEMINYFPYAYPQPDGEHPFSSQVTVLPTPWNENTRLMHVAIQGQTLESRAPMNLVFLVDTSGSMNSPDKLPLLKSAFKMLLGSLRPEDEVAIVTYAGTAGVALEPTSADQADTIMAAMDSLSSGGGTAGQAGLRQAYALANQMKQDGDMSRIMLATDGDFNIGISDPEELTDYISRERDKGIYLSIFGFGRGNLDDATMQALAQNGNGQAAYIDTINEARKVLVDQVQSFEPIADDLKIQVEFNPAHVSEYRLIGYETRSLRREDFSNDRVDAGDIGSGHSVTAIYEIAAPGSEGLRNEPLRYAPSADEPVDKGDEIAFVRLRYKAPGESESVLIEHPVSIESTEVSDDVGFSVAVAGFGQFLTNSIYLDNWSWDEMITLAQESKGEDVYGYRSEALQLMRLARDLER